MKINSIRLGKLSLLLIAILCTSNSSYSQILNSVPGEIHGNFQIDAQYYNPDSSIGAPPVPEKVLLNAFGNIIYTKGNFSAGARYESYLNPLQGFDPRYKGSGVPFRYARYKTDLLDITVGNFYEQFGNGIVLRAYEERGLGFDNALEGIRVKVKPYNGIQMTGLVGRQRSFFSVGPGIVRGFDTEISIPELLNKVEESKTAIVIGGSFVSKFQKDQDPVYILPENVGAFGGRISINRGKFGFMGAAAHKINDPSATNRLIYKNGDAFMTAFTYSQKGLGITLEAKRIDNMDFRSDRTAFGNNLNINYLPSLTKQHTYNLAATIYPYATQPNGEMAFQAEVTYKIKKGTPLGGKYGTNISVNYSSVNGLDTINLNNDIGYKSKFKQMGTPYFKDFNIEINRRFNKDFKGSIAYFHFLYNKDVVQGLAGYGIIYAHIGVLDLTYNVKSGQSLHMELQNLYSKQDDRSWAMGLVEYTIASKYFVAVMDQYNYGNEHKEKRIHYVTVSGGYMKNTTRISLSYGRQRAGIFCVGGICRNVPASNGLSISIANSF